MYYVIFSDFRHGIFNKRSIKKLIGAIPEKTYKVADSQVATRWGNILDFPEFDLITPNEKEARFSLGDQDSGIRPLAAALYDSSKCKTLILKLGAKGVIVCKNNTHEDLNSFFVVESFSKNENISRSITNQYGFFFENSRRKNLETFEQNKKFQKYLKNEKLSTTVINH